MHNIIAKPKLKQKRNAKTFDMVYIPRANPAGYFFHLLASLIALYYFLPFTSRHLSSHPSISMPERW